MLTEQVQAEQAACLRRFHINRIGPNITGHLGFKRTINAEMLFRTGQKSSI